jgi:hypothetical protein
MAYLKPVYRLNLLPIVAVPTKVSPRTTKPPRDTGRRFREAVEQPEGLRVSRSVCVYRLTAREQPVLPKSFLHIVM